MALWGEGDPRWESWRRESDAKNVNNWHWWAAPLPDHTHTHTAVVIQGREGRQPVVQGQTEAVCWSERSFDGPEGAMLTALLLMPCCLFQKGTCRVSEASYITGEASAKWVLQCWCLLVSVCVPLLVIARQKLIFFYEWEDCVEVDWYVFSFPLPPFLPSSLLPFLPPSLPPSLPSFLPPSLPPPCRSGSRWVPWGVWGACFA